MSRTYHHHSPPRSKLMKLPHKYTGWEGESLQSQEGIAWRKRVEHRAQRRWGIQVSVLETLDALLGVDPE